MTLDNREELTMSLTPCRHCGTNHHGPSDRRRCKESAKDYITDLEREIAVAEAAIRVQQEVIEDARARLPLLQGIAAGHKIADCMLCKGTRKVKHSLRGEIACDACGGIGHFVIEPWKDRGLNNWNNGPNTSPARW